ncbi:MAG: DNA primase [Cyclobacteriaceae bacterium]
MIPKETIEKVKELTDIVEVIDGFVQLKKSGSSYKGLSPFANEKTPSFIVSPAKQIFKDFSTGKGGDAISFLMEAESMSYLEAIKWLAQKYGVEIEEEEETNEQIQKRTEKDSLLILLNYAKEYYQDLLFNHTEGKSIGLSYFKERGFTEDTIKNFGLGYSLDQWDAFTKEALQKQYSLDLLDKSGLTIVKEEGKKQYDRFRDRVIFPIHNVSGKIIAFGARTLKKDKKLPKYVNSPETIVYHKSDVLYGLYQAKQSIRQEENSYLVEGYTDVIALHQAGIKNVVASSGTSLTTEQIRAIKRYSNTITVLYDGDNAGIKASMRGIDMILEEGLNVQAVVFPEGEDPDSYVKQIGADAFKEYLVEKKTDFITFKTNLFLSDTQNDPLKKANVIREVVESISKVPDAIQRTLFFKHCSDLLKIDEQLLISEYNKILLARKKKKPTKTPSKPSTSKPSPLPPLGDDFPYDINISTEEEGDYLPDGDYQSAGTPSVVEEEEDSSQLPQSMGELQEQSIARLLLNYGAFSVGEDTSLAKHLIEETNDVEFSDPFTQKVILRFKEAVQKTGGMPTIHTFLDDEDQSFKDKVIDLVTDKYELSENWENFSIYVPKEEDILSKVLLNTVLKLKWRKVKQLIKENLDKLNQTKESDEIMESQQMHMALKRIEMDIAKQIGNVIS